MFPRGVSTTRRVHVRVRALERRMSHTFRIRKTCICVTFNTWQPVCHILSHRCSWNEIQPHDFFLTYEPCSACNFCHTIPSLSTSFARCDGLRCAFTVKRQKFMQSFDLRALCKDRIRTCLCSMCHLISLCFMTTSMFPRKYFDYIMFILKFIHWKTCPVTLFVLWRCVRVQFDT